MAITAETIDHIREMPTVVGRIVEEVLPIDDPTQAEPRIDSILEEENYDLSRRQEWLFFHGLPVFQAEREGLLYVLQRKRIEKVKSSLANKFGIGSGAIENITIHPTSLTCALNSKSFAIAWNSRSEDSTDNLPRGFTKSSFSLPIGSHKVRYSFRDITRSDKVTAEHENLLRTVTNTRRAHRICKNRLS
ncbi:hypothetical protein A3A55_00730 [Candidatus Roizmanbacteria bacterium RIFCSPLOWO2_01_FULL_40_14]|uniref:Uncharacterized protein n=2 Tax=Candidatus Roizmaniibacteriota TaxID=1752723 RepID=A0A0G0XER9_9BACT|nr:MAG: hypothetical protein UU41_C0048G0003 [Candidatus Roizmanbacteria bacterium GW2011_GWA1_41_13]KKS22937.1 MAG: hypothetical protein UU78_C0009G0015 [Candidatus Roizmanbacteria bacterium GW2011_GWC2_41_7]OGK48593.1 MAG: hypothetical protein A3A55_00730 [Candidatus Roizmanbacteria bacterium RIFCSPLOWO2_01_FULL_40_14]